MNQARTSLPASSSRRGSRWPESDTSPDCHSSSKFCVNSAASSGERAVSTTFSWIVQESVVQLVEPVQTLSRSRTTYL